MRVANPKLVLRIKENTLGLLMEKEPEEISMREIAKVCGVTATTLYYYYKDKDTLFEEVKLECLEKMDSFIAKKNRGYTQSCKSRKGYPCRIPGLGVCKSPPRPSCYAAF
jgi:AcrR family transcriptional regulator